MYLIIKRKTIWFEDYSIATFERFIGVNYYPFCCFEYAHHLNWITKTNCLVPKELHGSSLVEMSRMPDEKDQ